MTDNVIDIRKPIGPDRMGKFVLDTEEDFHAIKLLARAIQQISSRGDIDGQYAAWGAPVCQIATEIEAHLEAIQDRLQGDDEDAE